MEEDNPRESLASAIRILISREVRLRKAQNLISIHYVINEMKEAIREAKARIVELSRSLEPSERDRLIGKLIEKSLEEEIDLAVEARKNKCLRCVHIRYFDEAGGIHTRLPSGRQTVQTLACEKFPSQPAMVCVHFRERSGTPSLQSYIDELYYYYELREMFHTLERLSDYLTSDR